MRRLTLLCGAMLATAVPASAYLNDTLMAMGGGGGGGYGVTVSDAGASDYGIALPHEPFIRPIGSISVYAGYGVIEAHKVDGLAIDGASEVFVLGVERSLLNSWSIGFVLPWVVSTPDLGVINAEKGFSDMDFYTRWFAGKKHGFALGFDGGLMIPTGEEKVVTIGDIQTDVGTGLGAYLIHGSAKLAYSLDPSHRLRWHLRVGGEADLDDDRELTSSQVTSGLIWNGKLSPALRSAIWADVDFRFEDERTAKEARVGLALGQSVQRRLTGFAEGRIPLGSDEDESWSMILGLSMVAR